MKMTPDPQKGKRSGAFRAGALFVLATCFVLSALVRAGDVVAALPEGGDDGFGNPIASPQPSGVTTGTKPEPEVEGGPMRLVAELQEQRKKLEARERKAESREQMLRTMETRIKERLDEIRTAREQLANTAALVDDAAGKDVRRLAAMYQQMKPKQAGQIFNEMAPSFAAGFIAEMSPEAAALIMANMGADKAYAVSLLIAGRNMQPPETRTQSE
jgi:flagellar motility protein MotE (MotC chaperone)